MTNYEIATNNYLTKVFTEDEFLKLSINDIEAHTLEDFEVFAPEDLKKLITDLALSMKQPLRAENSLEDLFKWVDTLKCTTTVVVHSTDLKLVKESYLDDVTSQLEYLESDVRETLYNHYGFTVKEAKQFLHINLNDLMEETYKAQTEHLLNAVNKFKG